MKKILLMITALGLTTSHTSATSIQPNSQAIDDLVADLEGWNTVRAKQLGSQIKSEALSDDLYSEIQSRLNDENVAVARAEATRQAFLDTDAATRKSLVSSEIAPVYNGGGGGSSKLTSRSAPVIAAKRASRSARSRSLGLCAKYVRIALQSAGYKFTPNPSAYQYATRGTLAKAGFAKISNNAKPQIGDVVVISRSRKNPHGHIAIYDGRNWVSDFRQKRKSPYREYYSYTTWRDARYLNDASNRGTYLALND